MYKRLPYYLILSLAVLCIVPVSHAGPGAVVQSWSHDATNNTVTLHIANTGGKDITAWNIKIKETYGNNVNEHEYSTDTLQMMLNVQESAGTADGERLRQQFGNGTFAAGTSRDETLHVQPNLTDYEAIIDAVLYADKTVEGSSKEALNRLTLARQVAATTMHQADAIIKKSMSNTTDAIPQETAAKEIRQLSQTWKAGRHATLDLDTGLLEGIARELDRAETIANQRNISVTDVLNEYVSKNERRASALSEHAKVGGAQ